MDASENLKRDVREGRIDPERLIDLIVELQRELQKARERIEELERKLGASTTSKTDEPYSLRAEEKRQEEKE